MRDSVSLVVDLFGPPIMASIVTLLAFGFTRTVNSGRPLTRAQRMLLTYGFVFCLLMMYSITAAAWFGWPNAVWIAFSVVLGASLLALALWRHKRVKNAETRSDAGHSISSRVVARDIGLFLALIVALFGSAVECDEVFEGRGSVLAALLWIAGVASIVALTGRNRRVIVKVSLRTLLAFAIIGAIAQHSGAAVIVTAVIGGVVLVLEMFWKDSKRDDVDPLSGISDRGTHSANQP